MRERLGGNMPFSSSPTATAAATAASTANKMAWRAPSNVPASITAMTYATALFESSPPKSTSTTVTVTNTSPQMIHAASRTRCRRTSHTHANKTANIGVYTPATWLTGLPTASDTITTTADAAKSNFSTDIAERAGSAPDASRPDPRALPGRSQGPLVDSNVR